MCGFGYKSVGYVSVFKWGIYMSVCMYLIFMYTCVRGTVYVCIKLMCIGVCVVDFLSTYMLLCSIPSVVCLSCYLVIL